MLTGGTYRVGTEIMPGIYRVAGMWTRLDTKQQVIADDAIVGDGGSLLNVQSTDAYVWISGMAFPIASRPPADLSMTTGGEFLVGFDIAPGRYRISPIGQGASWARLDTSGRVIDSEADDAPILVTVAATDWALKFTGAIAKLPS